MGQPLQVENELGRRLRGPAGRGARQQFLNRYPIEVGQLRKALYGHGPVPAFIGTDHDRIPTALRLLFHSMERQTLLCAGRPELRPGLLG